MGLLLPLSGPHAALGHSLRESAAVALDEINRILRRSHGRMASVSAFVEDIGSSPARFRRALSHLVAGARVASVFGLCPTGLRAEMRAIVDRHDSLFWDPAPTAGGECSGRVIHGGPTPYQSLNHLVPWMAEQVGGRFLLVGTDRPWPAELVRVGREMVLEAGATPVGPAELFPPGHTDFADTLARIRRQDIDVVLSALTGASAVAFFLQYRAAGFDPRRTPIASPTLTEAVAGAATPKAVAGTIAAAPYFADWMSPANTLFIQRLRRHAAGAVRPDAMAEALWFQIHQFAAAALAMDLREIVPVNIREAAKGSRIDAPEGPVRIESDTLYTRLWPKIAVVEHSGRFRVLACADEPVRPLPFWGWPGKACVDAAVVER
ncbi:MAG: transporter substrate-binding protein [Magnetospirillum sp.]|nr:transporter substrate-binding protein [Magnetospirillum sp.]